MGVPSRPTKGISPAMRTFEMGAFITRGGAITLDTYLDADEIFKVIFATTGGLINVEGIDGNTFIVAVQDNGGVPVVGRRILTTSTTATGLYCGGS